MVTLPRIAPILALPGALPARQAEHLWSTESKYDGQRAILYVPGDNTVVLRSRSGADITAAYPELHALAGALWGPAVLDGEIIAPDAAGRPDFEKLQARMGLSASPAKAARLAAQIPAHLVLFDVMHLEGRDLTWWPYSDRRQALEDLGLHGCHWSTPAVAVGHCHEAFELTRTHEWEGVVLKRRDSVYEPGTRSRSWAKIRHIRVADCVIGGWVPGRGSLSGLPGAVLVGEADGEGTLRYLGSVGTGWTTRDRAGLARLLRVATIPDCPFTARPPARARRPLGPAPPRRGSPLRHPHQSRTPAPPLLAPAAP